MGRGGRESWGGVDLHGQSSRSASAWEDSSLEFPKCSSFQAPLLIPIVIFSDGKAGESAIGRNDALLHADDRTL